MANQYTQLSPGVIPSELDLSARISIAISTNAGMVFESSRGTLKPFYTTSFQGWEQMYGNADPAISFGGDCAKAFHRRSSSLWNQRVVNGHLHAGMTYFKDNTSALAAGGRLLRAPFFLGTTDGFEAGSRAAITLEFSAALVTANSFTMQVTDGTTSATVGPVVFAATHLATMNAIATAIQTAMATFGSGGYALAHVETVAGADTAYVIRAYPPTTTTLLFNTPVVTAGASQATVKVNNDARLFDVLAENPGAWGNDIGVKITNVDAGQFQRFSLTLSGALVTGNTISATVNGTVVSTAFITNSDATLAAFATALAANSNIASATVVTVPAAADNDRLIQIVAKVAGPGALAISAAGVTGGASQAAILIQETLRGFAADGEFDFEVFSRANVNIPIERFRVSLAKRVNARGQQTGIDQRVNALASTGSNEVRVIIPETARTFALKPTLVSGIWTMDQTVAFLAGGTDGAKAMNSQIAAAWDVFKNRDKYQVSMLINAGYTDVSVQQRLVSVAEDRQDAVAVLDIPSDQQTAQAASDYRMTKLNIDSSYGAIYTPDLQVLDDRSDNLRYVPPSGHVAAVYAYSDANAAIWFAPAGLNRGRVPEVRGLRHDYDLGHRELMYAANVNFIYNRPGVGPVVFAEETLQRKKSALSSVAVRRLISKLKVAYADALDYVALFEPNNQFTRIQAAEIGERVLKPIKDAGGLYFYKVVCDDSNNTPETIDEELLRVDVYVQPTRTAKRVLLRMIIQRTGASFAETAQILNNAQN